MASVFQCKWCKKVFASKYNLLRHLSNVHKEIISSFNKQKFICPERDCSFQFGTFLQFICHLKELHDIELPSEELNFASEEDFLNWKCKLQRETLSEYVKNTSTKRLFDGARKMFLICHRSNQQPSKIKNRQRALKKQGYKKMEKSCPSRIEVLYNKNLTLSVKFWKTHLGHTNELEHASLDKPTRDYIAKKLKNGVTFDCILDEARSGAVNASRKTMLLERKDLYNIVRDYNIAYSKKHHIENVMSVELWVDDVDSLSEDSSVIFYECSCNDSVINMNECKHIHEICSHASTTTVNNEISLLIDPRTKQNVGIIQRLGSKVRTIPGMLDKLNEGDIDSKLIEKNIDLISSLNNVSSNTNSNKETNVTQQIEPQVRLFSTEKKPKNEELESETQLILYVHTGNDHTYHKR